MKPIVLIGGGGHCRSVIDIIKQQAAYSIVGMVDLKEKAHAKILGYEIIASDDLLIKEYVSFISYYFLNNQIPHESG